MTCLFLVRHGATDAIGHTYSGRTPGIHLNAEGLSQAQNVAHRLRGENIQAIYSSPSVRARQTADRIGATLGLPIEERDAFDEIDVGQWTGCSFAALNENAEFRLYNSARSITRPPSGEMMLEVQSRTIAELLRISGRHQDSSLVVVSHAEVIRSALAYFLGMPIDLSHRLEVGLATVSVVQLWRDWVQVLRING